MYLYSLNPIVAPNQVHCLHSDATENEEEGIEELRSFSDSNLWRFGIYLFCLVYIHDYHWYS